jgi:hypothetical protein
MTNHEKALKTYKELQKRKAAKTRKINAEVTGYLVDTYYKCLNERHDLKIYR